MDKHCFVVLELPGGEELKFVNQKSTPGFWKRVTKAIGDGKAKVISTRQDTGISEDLRQHVAQINKFTTYVFVDLHLPHCTCSQTDILSEVSTWISTPGHEVVIDTSEKFQLVTVDLY